MFQKLFRSLNPHKPPFFAVLIFLFSLEMIPLLGLTSEPTDSWVPRVGSQVYVGPVWAYRKTYLDNENITSTANDSWGVTGAYQYLYPKKLYVNLDGEWHESDYSNKGANLSNKSQKNGVYLEGDLGYTVNLTKSLRWMFTPFIGYRFEYTWSKTPSLNVKRHAQKNYIPLGFRVDWLVSPHWNLALKTDYPLLFYGTNTIKDPTYGKTVQKIHSTCYFEFFLPITWFYEPTGNGFFAQLVPQGSFRQCYENTRSGQRNVTHYSIGVELDLGFGF